MKLSLHITTAARLEPYYMSLGLCHRPATACVLILWNMSLTRSKFGRETSLPSLVENGQPQSTLFHKGGY